MAEVKQCYVMQNRRMDDLNAKPKDGTTGARLQAVVGQLSCVVSLLKLLNWVINGRAPILEDMQPHSRLAPWAHEEISIQS